MTPQASRDVPFEIRELDQLIKQCEQAQRAVLLRLRMPTAAAGLDPARIEALLRTRKNLTPTHRRRAQHALYALVLLGQIRHHVGPVSENARRAARAARAGLQAGLYCNDAAYHAERAARHPARKGGLKRGKQLTATADPQVRRARTLVRLWKADDNLQDEHPTAALFLAKRLGLTPRQAQRLAGKGGDSS